MADPILPRDLDAAPSVPSNAAIIIDNGVNVQKATPAQVADTARPFSNQAEAEAGTDNAKTMTPLRTAQAIDVRGYDGLIDGKEPLVDAGTTGQYYRGDKSWQALNKAAVGLGSADDTADADKPVSAAQQAALDDKTTAAAIGISGTATDMGPGGDILTDNADARTWFAELEDAILDTPGTALVKANATAIGVAPTDANMGTTPGTILSDNGTAKQWFQESEAAIEARAVAAISHSSTPTPGSLAAKALQTVTVTDAPFLADDTGANDAASAFSAAAQATYASDYIGGALESSLARPDRGYVHVPAGSYKLSSLVDTGGRDIVWLLDPAAVIDNPENINGTIRRGDGRATLQSPFGISDYATTQVATVGGPYADKPAPVTGVSTLQQLANYDDRDAVALIGAAYSSSALISTADATYTATTVTITEPSADVLKRLRRGMIIDTKHATRCTAIVSSWATGGGNLVITVAEWREEGGSSAVTPANGTGLYVSRMTKVWGGNFVANLDATGDVEQAVGIETTVYNSRGDSSATIGNTTNRAVGKYVYSAGPYKIQSGFQFAGAAHYGFTALDSENGFYSISAAGKAGAAFTGLGYAVLLRGQNTSSQQTFSISSSGNVEIGNISASSTPVIDFHSSGNNIDYDSRIIASGGSGSVGQGALTAQAASFRFAVTQMGFFGNAVVSRQTYGAPTGVANRTTFDTETVTLVELARRIKPLIDDLRSLGLLG